MIKAYVINMDQNSDRLKKCSEQLKKCGIEHERFAAIKGSSLSEEQLLQCYDEKRAMRLCGRTLSAGEIGCALSHLGVYKKMIAENIPFALVLEDDAYVLPPLRMALEAYENTMCSDEPVITLLGEGASLSRRIHRVYLPFSVYSLTQIYDGCRAHAYIVSLAAAKKMISFLLSIATPIDVWGRFSSYGIIKLYTIEPLCVGLDCSCVSTITDWLAIKPKRNVFEKCRRRFYRLFWMTTDFINAFFVRNFK